MIINSKKGHAKVKLDDKQMSAIMSALAVATVHWDELKDPEATATQEDLLRAGLHLIESYLKANGASDKEMGEVFAKLSTGKEVAL